MSFTTFQNKIVKHSQRYKLRSPLKRKLNKIQRVNQRKCLLWEKSCEWYMWNHKILYKSIGISHRRIFLHFTPCWFRVLTLNNLTIHSINGNFYRTLLILYISNAFSRQSNYYIFYSPIYLISSLFHKTINPSNNDNNISFCASIWFLKYTINWYIVFFTIRHIFLLFECTSYLIFESNR